MPIRLLNRILKYPSTIQILFKRNLHDFFDRLIPRLANKPVLFKKKIQIEELFTYFLIIFKEIAPAKTHWMSTGQTGN